MAQMPSDLPPRERYDELSHAWRHSADRALVATPPTPPPSPKRRRTVFLVALAVHALIVAIVVSRVTGPAQVPVAPVSMGDWNIEMESAGRGPLTALVYGPETGLHLVEVPAAGASAAEKRKMTAKLGKGHVRMISFGRSSLQIKATSPADAKGATLGARGRIITVYSDATGSGVRTGW